MTWIIITQTGEILEQGLSTHEAINYLNRRSRTKGIHLRAIPVRDPSWCPNGVRYSRDDCHF